MNQELPDLIAAAQDAIRKIAAHEQFWELLGTSWGDRRANGLADMDEALNELYKLAQAHPTSKGTDHG